MKKLALVMMVFGLGTIVEAQGGYSANLGRDPTIQVLGEAVVKVVPDEIIVAVGIETTKPELTAAREENREISARIVEIARKLEISDDDIQTDHLSIHPRWRNEYSKQDFLGYVARNSVVATLKDVATVEPFIAEALQAGANHVHGVDFRTSQLRRHRDRARSLALLAARQNSEAMAAVLGRRVGAPLSIAEGHYYMPSYGSGSWHWGPGRGQGPSQGVVLDTESLRDESEAVALGRISVRANVNVTFELVP